MSKKAVIFDLDGVIVPTDKYHYQSWKRMADDEGVYFDLEINENIRGVGRMEGLEIILESSEKQYNDSEKEELEQRKNGYFLDLINQLNPEDILPGVMSVLKELRVRGVKIAIGSSSKNVPFILEKIGMQDFFDAVADRNHVKNSKPNPEVFLLAADMLGVAPEDCVVVEDAEAGIRAALAGNMKVVGVGSASHSSDAHYTVKDLSCISINEMLKD